MKKYQSIKEFYPFYLSQHQNTACRRLHFVGSLSAILLVTVAFLMPLYWLLLLALVNGYLFAWIGHFKFEKNKPATFDYPLYSFICDWLMFRDILLKKIPW
jgi:hypothetical protein